MKNSNPPTKKVAYLILAHTDPEQLYNLTRSLDYESRIFIHLDKKSDIRKFKEYDYPSSVSFIEDRVKVSWAGFNMVVATLNLMKVAMEHSKDYSHLVLLSGLDYPIKPVQHLHEFLNNHSKTQFIRFIKVEDSPEHYLKIFSRHAFKNPLLPDINHPVLNKGVVFIDKVIRKAITVIASFHKKKPLINITPYFGSQWWAITPECALYILDFVKQNPTFTKYFQTAFAPDEYFFHTIIGNSPFLPYSTGLQEYEGRGTYRMANLHVIHPSLAYVYTVEDFDELKNTDKFFVRKVTSSSSSPLITKIKNELTLFKKEDV